MARGIRAGRPRPLLGPPARPPRPAGSGLCAGRTKRYSFRDFRFPRISSPCSRVKSSLLLVTQAGGGASGVPAGGGPMVG